MRKIKVPREANWRHVAVQACEQNNCNEDARKAMVKWSKDNEKHFAELFDYVLDCSCNFVIREIRHATSREMRGKDGGSIAEREYYPKGKSVPSKIDPTAHAAVAGKRDMNLLLLVINNKRLEDYTREDLANFAIESRLAGAGQLAWAIFADKLIRGLKPEQRVGDRWNNDALERMYKDAESKAYEKLEVA